MGKLLLVACSPSRRFCCRFLTRLPDSTMIPHPFAPQAPLEIPNIRHPQNVAHVAIHGDLLLLRAKLSRGGNALYVLDWKTGRILLVCTHSYNDTRAPLT